MTRLWNTRLRWLPLAAVYLISLGAYSVPWTGDQKLYISIAREMREAGSWLLPRFLGETRYFKPPFQYWVTWLGFDVFGLNFWGALLPSVIAAFATAALLNAILRLDSAGAPRHGVDARDPHTGWNAGALFLLTLGTLTYATVAQMEIHVCLFQAAAWWLGLKAVDQTERFRTPWLFAAFTVAGAAAWVKSPAYSAFWVLGYGFYLYMSGRVSRLKRPEFWAALVWGVVVGLAWYVAVLKLDGARFWDEYIVRESLEKKNGNTGSAASLWYALFYFCFPFTLMIAFALRELILDRRRDFRALFLGWLLPPAIFFTLHPYRVKTYLYVLVPLFCMALSRVPRRHLPQWIRLTSGIVPFLLLSALALVLRRADLVPLWLSIGLVLAGALQLGIARNRDGLFLTGAALAVLVVRLSAISLGEADIAPLRALTATLNPSGENTRIVMWDESANVWHEAGLLSLALARPIERLAKQAEIEKAIESGATALITDEQKAAFTSGAALHSSAALQWTPWARWKARAKFPFRELMAEGASVLGPDHELLKRSFWFVRRGVPGGAGAPAPTKPF